ncbi:MAG: hypothetical protein HOM47_07060 [Euryarchaeota archaeon]|nr:hypothetical protein [Euryarchaeota archaeon]MBT5184914.1 hypothetical protein [Euryarchaeota archaeon]
MRIRVGIVLLLMLLSATISTANPGGKGDDIRSRDCAGSCHASSSSNGVSSANLSIELPDEIYAGLLMEIITSVRGVDVSSNNLVGMALLINSDGAKDLPANDGWEVITDPNGGVNNYVEISDSFSSQTSVNRSWTLRAPSSPGSYELYLAVQHGSQEGGIAMSGISDSVEVQVLTVPENLPQLSPEWKPINSRLIGEETTITLETMNTESATVELKNGAEISIISVTDGKFTIPAAVNPGTVEWRVILEGEGPTQTSPWFRLTAQLPGWSVDETSLYVQGVALFLLGASLVMIQRPKEEIIDKKYDNTNQVIAVEASIPELTFTQTSEIVTEATPIPPEGLPEGWTMEQWNYYGHEHLKSLEGGAV